MQILGKRFDETVTVDSIFGKIKIEYATEPQSIGEALAVLCSPDHEVTAKATGYKATVLDGDYRGWNSFGLTRATALAGLMSDIGAHYGYALLNRTS